MLKFLIPFIVSFLVSWIKIRFKPTFSIDKTSGIQKFHIEETPRLGGLGIFLAFIIFTIFQYLYTKNISYIYLLLSSIPVFIGGFLEDTTKKVSPKWRLLFASFSAFLVLYLFDIYIYKLDIPFIDYLLQYYPFAFIFTIFAITGVSNAYNIIDGFNGLSSTISILVLTSFAYLGYFFNDDFVFSISLALVFAILGFLVWNYPFGKIFLGDGGAYFLGFIIGFFSVYIVFKYKEVSPWYPMLLSVYPIFETIYSIYRRKFIKELSPTEPDAFHLHTLFYRRLIPKLFPNISKNKLYRNSLVMPLIIAINIPFIVIANLFWNNTFILMVATFLFSAVYVYLYTLIIKFKIGKILKKL